MNIYLLTTTYPYRYSPKGTTPVVHYFTKEWARTGHHVHVFHMVAAFPGIYYYFAKMFKSILDTKLGHLVPNEKPKEYEESVDGVSISHITIKKAKPHGRYPRKQIQRAFCEIEKVIAKEGIPDCFVGHWDNPQLDLLKLLKVKYSRPTCLVFHSNQFAYLNSIYGSETKELLDCVNLIGFRNLTAKNDFVRLFGEPKNSFIAASGVSRPFLDAGNAFEKTFTDIKNFIYVGLLMERKYPTAVVEALAQNYRDAEFDMVFIGNGDEQQKVQDTYNKLSCKGSLVFTGRIPREDVIGYLKGSDVFVMISKDEIFGLVYLEAMALGCITIAARNEGVDGIIEDGVNGFLCEAGNVDELASIINRIRSMTLPELNKMSKKAKETAIYYSDVNVANRYLNQIIHLTV